MNSLMLILVTVNLAFGLSAAEHEIHGRIFKGKEARNDQFKYMVLIFPQETKYFGLLSKKYRCGGTIIAPNWVLTAAHCLNHVSTAKVYLGAHTVDDAEKVYKVKKTAFIIHPNFENVKTGNDIALIQIPKTNACEKIKFTNLPLEAMYRRHQTLLAGKIGLTMGWGQPDDNSRGVERLQWTSTSIISNAECQAYTAYVTESQLCVNTRGWHGSPCQGDSGGPLILRETGEQIGIISHSSTQSCQAGSPVLFTRITSFLQWISAVTGII